MGAVGNLGVIEWPYKLVSVDDSEAGTTSYELFNVVQDPSETNDLKNQMPDLTQRLIAHIKAMPEPEVNRLEPEYNNSPRYYDPDIPDHDQRHEATHEPWTDVVTKDN